MDQASSGGFARICVFCGSSSGKKPIYTEVAQQLGSEMVTRGIDLVYGGGRIGLMGTVAKAVQDAGGRVVGVIPKALMPEEICGATVGDLVAVDDMHQRKAEMARRADAFIALPGGFGTFEEVLEIITWAQLGIHKKPVGFLNVDGYYDEMLAMFDKALDQCFLTVASRNIVVDAPTAAALLDKLKNYSSTDDKSVPELTWETTNNSTWDVSASASKLKEERFYREHISTFLLHDACPAKSEHRWVVWISNDGHEIEGSDQRSSSVSVIKARPFSLEFICLPFLNSFISALIQLDHLYICMGIIYRLDNSKFFMNSWQLCNFQKPVLRDWIGSIKTVNFC